MSESITVDYKSLPDQVLRPYLIVDVTGPNGIAKRIFGIVDSGADNSCFPSALIAEFGYDRSDLIEEPMTQAGGTTVCWKAKTACTAVVPDFPSVPFSITPTFLEGSFVLWGRNDLMNTFDIQILQSQHKFVMTTH